MNKSNLLKNKKDAVNEVMLASTKKISKTLIKKTAKKYDLSPKQLRHAYQNFANFGKVDLRYKSPAAAKAKNNVSFNYTTNCIETCKRVHAYKHRDFTTDEICEIIHKYLFSGDRRKITTYLDDNKIGSSQWYSWVRELSISGKINGRKILDYRKYGKINVKLLFKFCRARTLYGWSFKAMKSQRGWAKNLTKPEFMQFERASHVLNAYL